MARSSAQVAIRQIGTLYSLGTLVGLTDAQFLERFLATSGVELGRRVCELGPAARADGLGRLPQNAAVFSRCGRCLPGGIRRARAHGPVPSCERANSRTGFTVWPCGPPARFGAATGGCEPGRSNCWTHPDRRMASPRVKATTGTNCSRALTRSWTACPSATVPHWCSASWKGCRDARPPAGSGSPRERFPAGSRGPQPAARPPGAARVTLSAAPLAVLLGKPTAGAMPATLVSSTVKFAGTSVWTASGAIPAAVATLARGVLRTMLLTKLKITATALALVLLGLATGRAALLGGPAKPAVENAIALHEPAEKPATAPAGKNGPKPPAQDELFAPYSWRSSGTYEPPDFYRFFPDDPAGGRILDEFWTDENSTKRPVAEILRTVPPGAAPDKQRSGSDSKNHRRHLHLERRRPRTPMRSRSFTMRPIPAARSAISGISLPCIMVFP